MYTACADTYNLCMGLYSPDERRFLTAVANLAYCNPFLPERIEYERAALGEAFVSTGDPFWSAPIADPAETQPNVALLHQKLNPVVDRIRVRLEQAPDVSEQDLTLYEETVHQLLYERYYKRIVTAGGQWRFYKEFAKDWEFYLQIPGKRFETGATPAHVFAAFWQIQRAFTHIFDNIIGISMPAARLRASIWQSVLTCDMRRYRRTMWKRMPEYPTLITGPSGSGKELVARAIGGSRYIAFDPVRMAFEAGEEATFLPINVAALSPALVESELFGHRRGSFTGAIADRKGWLETCPALGSVFLDELGEMDLSIQVKLLRVIETRRFSAVGDTTLREFQGKLIAATNRDLPAEIRAKRFREDLYYRLCADLIQTPSLAEQIADSPEVLHGLLLFMTRRVVGDEALRCLPEVEEWVHNHLPKNYRWPGNYRELEQCVRNIVIRRSYRPLESHDEGQDDSFFDDFRAGRLKAADVLAYYAAQVYRQTGSYEETARRLDLDRRTIKAKVDSYEPRTN